MEAEAPFNRPHLVASRRTHGEAAALAAPRAGHHLRPFRLQGAPDLFSRSLRGDGTGAADRTLLWVFGAPELRPAQRLTPTHPQVLDRWIERRGDLPAPRRHGFETSDLVDALPNMLAWEPDGRGSYRCRVSGSAVDEQIGYALGGMSLDHLPRGMARQVRSDFTLVRGRCMLSYSERTMAWAGNPATAYCHLLMPLLGDGDSVERLLSVITFDSVSRPFVPLPA
jgi:hypothetical protein